MRYYDDVLSEYKNLLLNCVRAERRGLVLAEVSYFDNSDGMGIEYLLLYCNIS